MQKFWQEHPVLLISWDSGYVRMLVSPDLECRPPDGRIYEFRCALHRCIMPPAQTCYGMYFNTDSLRFFVAFATVNTA